MVKANCLNNMPTLLKKELKGNMSKINNSSKRLETIVEMIDDNSKIADVGSDHCYVPIACCKANKITFAQAIDNKKGPFTRMSKAIKESGYDNKIIASLSNGLDELDERVDTLIIAGMGGKLIISILENNIKKIGGINTIIIDAHNDRKQVIKYLEEIGYYLTENRFIYEADIAYDIMKWKKGKNLVKYTDEELEFGPLNLVSKSPAWEQYWISERERLINVLNSNDLPNSRKNECKLKIASIEKVLQKTN